MFHAKKSFIEKVVFSNILRTKNRNHKIAYAALMTALVVVANMFFEFKFMDVQFSFTIAVSALTGLVLGPLLGFAACFVGDLVGFLYNSGGYPYMPWVGLSMALTAVFAGVAYNLFERNTTRKSVVIGVVVSLFSFVVCTVLINTTAFWLLYSPKTPYWVYLTARLLGKGQIYNCLVNYVLIIIGAPMVEKLLYKSNHAEESAEKE